MPFAKSGIKVLFVVLMFFCFSNAQETKYGARLGLGISSVSFDDKTHYYYNGSIDGVTIEGAFGVLMPMASVFSFHPELAFQFVTMDNEDSNDDYNDDDYDDDYDDYDYDYDYYDGPLVTASGINLLINPLFRISFFRFFFDLGPSFNWNINSKWEVEDTEIEVNRKFAYGFLGGFGFKFSRHWEIDGRFVFWANPYEETEDYMGSSLMSTLVFSGNYWF